MSFNGAYIGYPTFSFYINMQISFVPLCEDLCVLSGKKINPLTLPTGRQAQRITKVSTKVHKGLLYNSSMCITNRISNFIRFLIYLSALLIRLSLTAKHAKVTAKFANLKPLFITLWNSVSSQWNSV